MDKISESQFTECWGCYSFEASHYLLTFGIQSREWFLLNTRGHFIIISVSSEVLFSHFFCCVISKILRFISLHCIIKNKNLSTRKKKVFSWDQGLPLILLSKLLFVSAVVPWLLSRSLIGPRLPNLLYQINLLRNFRTPKSPIRQNKPFNENPSFT